LVNTKIKCKCLDDRTIAGSLCTYKSRCSNDFAHREPGYNVATSHAEVKFFVTIFYLKNLV